MKKEEMEKHRLKLAKTVISAHTAYVQAMEAAKDFGMDCRNLQHIVYIDARDRVHTVLINAKELLK